MSAYVIVDIDVTDPVQYEEYKKLAGPTVPTRGGKYIVRGGRTTVLEGDWNPSRIVVLEFPTTDDARTWVNCALYAPARKIRHAAAHTNMIVVEGV